MMNIYKWILALVILTWTSTAYSQKADTTIKSIDTKLVQFSGIVVTADSLKPVGYVSIYDQETGRGTVSDYYGFFSFVAIKGDTIVFSCTGFKRAKIVIPDTLTENRYSLIQMMQNDTIELAPFIAYPWPSKEQFATAFVNLELPDDYVAKAEKNMRHEDLRIQSEGLPNDPRMAYYASLQKEQYRMYYAGQIPPNNLLNPIAWYKFVQAWKNGDFKRQ